MIQIICEIMNDRISCESGSWWFLTWLVQFHGGSLSQIDVCFHGNYYVCTEFLLFSYFWISLHVIFLNENVSCWYIKALGWIMLFYYLTAFIQQVHVNVLMPWETHIVVEPFMILNVLLTVIFLLVLTFQPSCLQINSEKDKWSFLVEVFILAYLFYKIMFQCFFLSSFKYGNHLFSLSWKRQSTHNSIVYSRKFSFQNYF